MANSSSNVWRVFWTLIHEWFCAAFIHLYIIHTLLDGRNHSQKHHNEAIDDGNESEDALERLRNITEMFSAKSAKDEKQQQLSKVEKFVPSEKIKNTFQKFEDIGASNGHFQRDDDDEDENDNDDEGIRPNGVIRSARIKKASKEHVPYHEMAEVKDKFEKGLVDVNKPRAEKRLDFRIQSGLTSSKKQAFEQGEFEQEVESHVNKIQIETDLVAGLTSSKKQAFEQQQQQQHMENDANQMNRTIIMERDALIGVAMEKKAKFESGELAADRPKISGRPDEIETIVGSGLAQAKRSEILSKIENEQQVQRSTDRVIDIDTEQGLAIARREQLASLANSEFKSTEKHIDVTAGLATAIKEQYIADASKVAATVTKAPVVTNDIESGLAKNRAIVFEKPDETTVRRTVDIDSELRERGVAKERVAMFKNLENGSQSSTNGGSGDTKIRVDLLMIRRLSGKIFNDYPYTGLSMAREDVSVTQRFDAKTKTSGFYHLIYKIELLLDSHLMGLFDTNSLTNFFLILF
ncbi:unnamed protein product [Adineta ricciae]|uniref:Uncharacterized protein n=1 Tax=Adineta ricciae TaxID=249248 RepID=A0A815EDU7_ADIRI|nr:unnamed protein product [Adineta ricciae]